MDRIARCGPWLAPSSQRSSCPAGLICMSTNRAAAQPGCTASGLSSALAYRQWHRWLAGEPSRGRGRCQQRRRERDPHVFRESHRPVAAAAGHRQSAAHPAHFLPAAGFGRRRGPAVRRDERIRVSIYICVIHVIAVARIENIVVIVGFVVDAKCRLLNPDPTKNNDGALT